MRNYFKFFLNESSDITTYFDYRASQPPVVRNYQYQFGGSQGENSTEQGSQQFDASGNLISSTITLRSSEVVWVRIPPKFIFANMLNASLTPAELDVLSLLSGHSLRGRN